MSSSALPYKRNPPSWLKITSQEVCNVQFLAVSYVGVVCISLLVVTVMAMARVDTSAAARIVSI